MSDNLDWLNDDDDQPSPSDLRKQLAKAKRDLKAAQDALAEKDSTIADLTGKVKATSLRDALTEAGVDPKFAKIAERDGVEPTVDAVKKWREENDGIYAFTPVKAPEASEDAGDDEGDGHEDPVDPELQAGIAAGQTLEGTGRPSGSITHSDALREARHDLGRFKTEAEVDAYLRSLGAPSLASLGGSVEE